MLYNSNPSINEPGQIRQPSQSYLLRFLRKYRTVPKHRLPARIVSPASASTAVLSLQHFPKEICFAKLYSIMEVSTLSLLEKMDKHSAIGTKEGSYG
jgi:hypothetical protein